MLFGFLFVFAIITSENKGGIKMNTDKIYAERLASEYTPKETPKVVALRKLDAKAKLPANITKR